MYLVNLVLLLLFLFIFCGLGGFNSKAKMAAEMSLGLQNSTFVSTHGDSSRIVSPDNTPSTEVEAKRLQELQDLRAITNQGIPEKASSSDIKSENVSPSGDTKKGGVTQHEEAVTVNSSNDELQEIPKSTPNGAVTADVYLCSGPEMMTLFSDPGLSFLDIEPVVPLTGWKSVKRFMFGPPKLNRSLVRERDTIFALAKMPLDNASKLHTSMLQTVYLKLVGKFFIFPRIFISVALFAFTFIVLNAERILLAAFGF